MAARKASRHSGRRSKRQLSASAHGKLRRGRRPSTAAGEFVHEEMHHVRRGKHGAKNAKQAIAIGLSKARRAGVPVPRRKR
jgi:Family of unknown function (DUF6496)